METKFERRLSEILTEYPDADPEKVAQALRTQPEASNYYIALLSGVSFEEVKRIARGNLVAMYQEKLCLRILHEENLEKAQLERQRLKDKDLH